MAVAAAPAPFTGADRQNSGGSMVAPEPVDFSPCGYTPLSLRDDLDSESLLIVDARPYSEYLVSHIRGALSVRLSSLMTRRLSKGSNQLYDLVIQEQKQRYRDIYERPGTRIVVYDACTTDLGDYDSKNPLHVILKSLCTIGDKECGYLLGGFTRFQAEVPDGIMVPDVVVNQSVPAFPMMGSFDEPLSAALMSTSPSPFGGGFESESVRARKILNIAPSVIEPYLIIGSKRDAADRDVLRSFKVTHVLNATPDCPCHFHEDLTYLRLSIKDCWNQNLPSHFDAAFSFIERAKAAGGRVMIHCTAGISRSAAIAIAYLMSTKRMSVTEAYAFVKSKRPVISPNLDFMGELQQFERTLELGSPSSPSNS
eukprot:m.160750 g.160750  ORF g.160750 m.160750 type:complete len:368 (+) comp11988_c0_seq1:195-1298(+)